MRLKINKVYIIITIFLAITLQAFSQNVKLSIEAPKEALVNDKFRIAYIVESDVEIIDNPEIGNIKGLDILYGPAMSQSSSMTTDNDGKRQVKYSVAYSYVVVASKSNKITIPKFEIELDGKKYESNTAIIKIVNSPDKVNKNTTKGAENNEKTKNKIKKIIENTKIEAFIKIIPSKNRVNPTDTLSVVYKLYTTSEDFKIVDTNLPSSRMFYSQTYRPNNEQGKQETIKGVKYYVFDIYKTILQPRDIGSVTMNDGNIKLVYYIKTGQKMKNYRGDEYDAVAEKEIDLKIDGISVSIFELTDI